MRPHVALSLVRALVLSCFFLAALVPSTGQAQERRTIWNMIDWQNGPSTGMLGLIADIGVPSYCKLADGKGTRTFLEATGNVPSGSEVGLLLCDPAGDSSYWFVVFDFQESGYVKDDEKATLDAAKILKTLQDGQEAGNEVRRSRGLDELLVTGWERPPYYDPVTNNLTWSVRVRTKDDPEENINHSVRLLGRRGVMHVDLVADQKDMALAVPAFDSALTEFGYFTGHTYSEWKPGDKVAEYGLTALVAGGAGLAAVKLGLFAKLWKWILGVLLALKKFVIVLILGIGAFFKKLFKRTPKSEPVSPPKPATPRSSTRTPPAPVRAPSDAYKPPAPSSPAASATPGSASVRASGASPGTPHQSG
jgi:uncharacterized membrane-anchored protein